MRSDEEIKRDVEKELRWDPDIDESDIGVAVRDGVVMLSGFVRSYRQRRLAEQDAKRVVGVAGVANDIHVRLPIVGRRPDPKIVRDAVAAIKREVPEIADRIRVLVEDGWITLEGEVETQSQREQAEYAVGFLPGVTGITNSIELKPSVPPGKVRERIEEAFRRSALLEASRITVEANGGEVILKGTVGSWAERQEAERAAWAAPGITKLINQIEVRS